VKLVLLHANGTLEARTLGDDVIDTSSLGGEEPLEVRASQVVQLWIADPNPVVFKYEWQGLTFEKNADYEQALAFAKSIKKLVDLMSSKKVGGPENATFQINVDQFVSDLRELQIRIESIPELSRRSLSSAPDPSLKSSATPDPVQSVKDEVRGWKLGAIESRMKSFYATLDDQLAADLVANAATPAPPSPPPPSPAPAPLSGGGTPAGSHQLTVTGTPNPTISVGQVGTTAKVLQPKVDTLLKTARTFVDAVEAINQPYKLGEIPYDFKQNTTATIAISAADGQQDLAAKSGRLLGTFKIPVRAYYPAHYSVAPAAIYSFVKAPQFTAVKRTTDAKFDIVQTDEKPRALTVGAMFSITPRWCSEPTFGCAFQIGVSPVKDQIGLFGGTQIRLTDVLAIGFGYAYQQVPKLAKNLSLTTPIDAPEVLKTDPHYRGGAYISFDVKLPE